LGKYYGLKDETKYRNKTLSHYRTFLDHYRTSKLYPKPYRNPKPVKRYSRPPVERRGRGRLPLPKPNYFRIQKPEKKYELAEKPEKMSSPLVEKPPRYTLENRSIEAWPDTEQIAKEVEKGLESKLTEQILEKFGAKLEELMQKVERVENLEKSTEQEKLEPKQEVERHAETQMQDGQKSESETARIESKEDSSEVREEPKEDNVSLEGGFKFSEAFGLAIPIEVDETELEPIAQERENKEEPSEREHSEIEHVENESQPEAEGVEQEDIESEA
jgi:hypothetical protein